MTTEDIADAVVERLAAIASKLVEFAVSNPPILPEYEAEESDESRVDVIPYAEEEESIAGDDTCKSRLTVTIVAAWPVALPGRDRATSIAAVKQLRDALREHKVDRYRWQSCETVSLFDADVLRTKNRFLSVFRATYFDVN